MVSALETGSADGRLQKRSPPDGKSITFGTSKRFGERAHHQNHDASSIATNSGFCDDELRGADNMASYAGLKLPHEFDFEGHQQIALDTNEQIEVTSNLQGIAEMPCVADDCGATWPYISGIIRCLKKHTIMICARCWLTFCNEGHWHAHRNMGCNATCVMHCGTDLESLRSAEATINQRHLRRPSCAGGRSAESRAAQWRYLYALTHPGADVVPDLVLKRKKRKKREKKRPIDQELYTHLQSAPLVKPDELNLYQKTRDQEIHLLRQSKLFDLEIGHKNSARPPTPIYKDTQARSTACATASDSYAEHSPTRRDFSVGSDTLNSSISPARPTNNIKRQMLHTARKASRATPPPSEVVDTINLPGGREQQQRPAAKSSNLFPQAHGDCNTSLVEESVGGDEQPIAWDNNARVESGVPLRVTPDLTTCLGCHECRVSRSRSTSSMTKGQTEATARMHDSCVNRGSASAHSGAAHAQAHPRQMSAETVCTMESSTVELFQPLAVAEVVEHLSQECTTPEAYLQKSTATRLEDWVLTQDACRPDQVDTRSATTDRHSPSAMPDLSSVHCCPTISDADTDVLRRIDRYLLRANDHIEDTNEAELIAAAVLSKIHSAFSSRGAVDPDVVVDMICGTENVLSSTMRREDLRDHLMALHNGVALDQQAFAEMVSSIWTHLCDMNYPAFVARLSTTNESRLANSHAVPAASNDDTGISSEGHTGLKDNRTDKNRRGDIGNKRSNKGHDFEKGPNKRPHVDHEPDEGRANSGAAQYQLPCIKDVSECIGTDPHISNLVRRIESHDIHICARCFTSFENLTEKHQHGTKCEQQCVLSDCTQSPPHVSDSSSILAIKHKEAKGCPSRKGKASQIWRYIYAMCHPDSEAVPEPGCAKAHIAPTAAPRPFVRRQCRARIQDSEEVRLMLQDSRSRIILLEEQLVRARGESDAILNIERAEFTLQTTKSDLKIKSLQDLLRLCREYVPSEELRRQIDEACPLPPATTTDPPLMQKAADTIVPQVYPNTPQPTVYSTTTSLRHEPRVSEQHMFGPPIQSQVGRIAQAGDLLRDKSHSMPLNASGFAMEQIDGTNNISAEEFAHFFSGPGSSNMDIFNDFAGGMNDEVW